MTEVRVRAAIDLVDDLQLTEEIARCWREVSNAGGAVGFPFPPVSIDQVNEATERLVRDVESGAVLVFVADADGEVVGWVSLRFNRSEIAKHWASVERLQSRPDWRGRGIGGHLLAALTAHAGSIGLEQLQLVLRGGEMLEDFYERLGWEEIGRHPGALRLPDGDRDEVLMLLDVPKIYADRDADRRKG